MLPRWLGVTAAAFCLLSPGWAGAQITAGQVDNFEDGTTQGWAAGVTHPAPPFNMPTGGPGGADDNYLMLTSTGSAGPGSRLTAFNRAQWTGDFASAGVGTIEMDAINLGQTDLTLRILLINLQAPGDTDAAYSLPAPSLAPGSGWQHISFAIDPGSLVLIAGDLSELLGSVNEMRIAHAPDAVFPPELMAANLGVDNIRAVPGSAAPVPEPSALAGLGAAAAALAAHRSRSRRAARR